MKNLKVKGFTLAETLITLTILGVVAAITIPALINKYNETANRTRLKKAMAAYEKALNQMIVDNDIKGSITAVEGFRLTDNCSGSRPYFKAIKEITGNNCRFQTADKVWWDITDIEHPVISLKDQLTDAMVNGVKANSADYKDDKTLFSMTGEITNGIVRINDQADTGLSIEAKANLDKIYAFIDKVKSGENNTVKQGTFMASNCVRHIYYTDDERIYMCNDDPEQNYYKFKFTDDEFELPDGNKSKAEMFDETLIIVTGEQSNFNDAKSSCPEGMHLAKAAELNQLYNSTNNGISSYAGYDVSNKWFWVSDGDGSSPEYFLSSNGEYYTFDRMNDVPYGEVVCVGN